MLIDPNYLVLPTGIEPAPLPWKGNDSTILSSGAKNDERMLVQFQEELNLKV